MSVPFRLVDAFTGTRFAGNPAPVFILDEPRVVAWYHAVAVEMNASNTAFLIAPGDGGDGSWGLRWFTPKVETHLCGHGTLASAHVLWEDGYARPEDPIRFDTLAGELTAFRRHGGICELDFPAEALTALDPPPGLVHAIGSRVGWIGRGHTFIVAELGSEQAVRSLEPDLGWLEANLPDPLVVTARSDDPRFDVVSRVFAPAIGIPEDPATGSAHCAVGPHWGSILGRTELRVHQLSERGGELTIRVMGDRVRVGGQAITLVHGEFME
ncbi:MAG TPA: PhzF family phenazine biosynthesis protein [Candidatus Dormibacteraeota bacterium]|nr:PhzF family phenazine biosynthesis protein [Candidatus Dormibacteraeota bacterium]